MNDKHYNLSEPFNKDVKDEAPKWMDSFFNREPKEDKKEYNKLFEKPKSTLKKCTECGNILAENEVKFCKNCI